ncbi:MAG: hypothetical protein GY708_01115 [Actinomycetia bacterium]|nr:hypothetical protein [Actinomycetes bacterium]
MRNRRTTTLEKAITGDGIYKMVKAYGVAAGVTLEGLCLHALRATAATNALAPARHTPISCVNSYWGDRKTSRAAVPPPATRRTLD